MHNLNAEDYNQILKFISVLQKSHDDYRHLVVLLLAQYFNFDHAIFFLSNERNELIDPITLNVCDDFLKRRC